jgi:23S rRNA (adenine2030-N6)-methyltransferase
VKDARVVGNVVKKIAESGVRRVLRLELAIEAVATAGKLARTGLILINPPYTLDEEAAVLLPVLAHKLARASQAEIMREWIAGE